MIDNLGFNINDLKRSKKNNSNYYSGNSWSTMIINLSFFYNPWQLLYLFFVTKDKIHNSMWSKSTSRFCNGNNFEYNKTILILSQFQMTQNGILFKTLFTSSKMNVYSFKYTNLLYMHMEKDVKIMDIFKLPRNQNTFLS